MLDVINPNPTLAPPTAVHLRARPVVSSRPQYSRSTYQRLVRSTGAKVMVMQMFLS